MLEYISERQIERCVTIFYRVNDIPSKSKRCVISWVRIWIIQREREIECVREKERDALQCVIEATYVKDV